MSCGVGQKVFLQEKDRSTNAFVNEKEGFWHDSRSAEVEGIREKPNSHFVVSEQGAATGDGNRTPHLPTNNAREAQEKTLGAFVARNKFGR